MRERKKGNMRMVFYALALLPILGGWYDKGCNCGVKDECQDLCNAEGAKEVYRCSSESHNTGNAVILDVEYGTKKDDVGDNVKGEAKYACGDESTTNIATGYKFCASNDNSKLMDKKAIGFCSGDDLSKINCTYDHVYLSTVSESYEGSKSNFQELVDAGVDLAGAYNELHACDLAIDLMIKCGTRFPLPIYGSRIDHGGANYVRCDF